MKGFTIGKKENKLGMRCSDTATLLFENVRVPGENLLGKVGEGFKQALKVLDGGRVGIAALSATKVVAGITSHGVTLGRPGEVRHAGVGDTVIGGFSGVDENDHLMGYGWGPLVDLVAPALARRQEIEAQLRAYEKGPLRR